MIKAQKIFTTASIVHFFITFSLNFSIKCYKTIALSVLEKTVLENEIGTNNQLIR